MKIVTKSYFDAEIKELKATIRKLVRHNQALVNSLKQKVANDKHYSTNRVKKRKAYGGWKKRMEQFHRRIIRLEGRLK